jgi:hypothetical protein
MGTLIATCGLCPFDLCLFPKDHLRSIDPLGQDLALLLRAQTVRESIAMQSRHAPRHGHEEPEPRRAIRHSNDLSGVPFLYHPQIHNTADAKHEQSKQNSHNSLVVTLLVTSRRLSVRGSNN